MKGLEEAISSGQDFSDSLKKELEYMDESNALGKPADPASNASSAASQCTDFWESLNLSELNILPCKMEIRANTYLRD